MTAPVRATGAIRQQRLAVPLAVSHTVVTEVAVISLRVEHGDVHGTGEVAVGPWTTEPAETVRGGAVAVAGSAPAPATVDDVAGMLAREPLAGRGPTTRMLVEMALLDLLARRAALPLWRLLGLPQPEPYRVFRTLSVGAAPDPADTGPIKVKLGGPRDVEVLRRLAQDPDRPVIVDVNRGWSRADWTAVRDPLRRVRLQALEDPVADPGLLPEVRSALPGVPVLLDEGIRTAAQAVAALDRADGANVKLAKMGGLLAAGEALSRVRDAGGRRMLGCFVEPPDTIAYAAQVAGLADWTDLDGHLLLTGDPVPDRLRLDTERPGRPVFHP
ncbi:enolase C-terminal domain-like protein [Actinoplanes sp. NPDC023801]|uniref:enolase C-terminal domain-like protein n=1 Tax=Actinoplanes sp. NPDC023801 TaxID=3154595 RepID=UPI0033C27A4E